MVIAQLRGTIFVPLAIGYTPENARKFSELLLPESKPYSANAPEAIAPGINPAIPQYGMPWRLFKKSSEEGDYNIVFLPGKIDIILTKDTPYGDEIERLFCDKCIELFSKLLKELNHNTKATRIAFAPVYAIRLDENSADMVWSRLLKRTMIDGMTMKDVNFNFLLKRQLTFNGRTIQMNLLHNFSDGMQIKQTAGEPITYNVVLLQLDLNSVPEEPLALDADGIKDFFNGILAVKSNLVNNVTE